MTNQLIDQAAAALNSYIDMHQQLYSQFGYTQLDFLLENNPKFKDLDLLVSTNLFNLLLEDSTFSQQILYHVNTHPIHNIIKIVKLDDIIPYREFNEESLPTIENPIGLNLKVSVHRNPTSQTYVRYEDYLDFQSSMFFSFLALKYGNYHTNCDNHDLSKACLKYLTVGYSYDQEGLQELNCNVLDGFLIPDFAPA
jgi:hypothetical protein